MITIVVDRKDEYRVMMGYAREYVCRHRTFAQCAEYPSNNCDKCYEDNHIKVGIRIISPVDNPSPDQL